MSTKAHAGLEAKLVYQGAECAVLEAIGDRTIIRAKIHADCTPGRLLVAAVAERNDIGRIMAAGPELAAALLAMLDRSNYHSLDCASRPGSAEYDPNRCDGCAAERARLALRKAGVQP